MNTIANRMHIDMMTPFLQTPILREKRSCSYKNLDYKTFRTVPNATFVFTENYIFWCMPPRASLKFLPKTHVYPCGVLVALAGVR